MADDIDASLARIRQMQAAVPPAADQAPISLPRAPEQRANPWDVLTRLGFAMASSRNPSLFGQLGEAGINLQDYQRQQRRDTREENELELNRVYREAQLNFQREQLRGDPVRLATAEAALLDARARLQAAERQGAAAGREGQYVIPGSIHEGPNGNAWAQRRDGTNFDMGVPIDNIPGATSARERALNAWRQRRDAAAAQIDRDLPPLMPGAPRPPAVEAQRRERMQEWLSDPLNQPPTAPSITGRGAPAPERPVAPPPVVLDSITGRARQ